MTRPAATELNELHSATTRSVRVLPPELVSRIAAGEVVERPASIIKELVENALDAGARNIHIELLGGGRQLVRVSDDGFGMTREDLQLCVLPHATSKIEHPDDLNELATLGFRGEALPSIAAVSRFSITTRRRDSAKDDGAWKIEINGGQPERPEAKPAAGAYGTTVEARDLFFNLPAREKFLKGPGIEAAACTDTLLRLALTRPDVSFTLRSGSQEIFSLPAAASASRNSIPLSAYLRRSREVLGTDNSRGLFELLAEGPLSSDEKRVADDGEMSSQNPKSEIRNPKSIILSESFAGYRLFGVISPPSITRPNRSSIYLTVNGRAVKDRTLTSAFLESYRHLLPNKRYPVGVLFLELPGGDVDINVHPTKAEVRFRVPGLVYALFHHAIRTACGVPTREVAAEKAEPATPEVRSFSTASKMDVPLGAPKPLFGQKTLDLRVPTEAAIVGRGDAETRGRGEQIEGAKGRTDEAAIFSENTNTEIRTPNSDRPTANIQYPTSSTYKQPIANSQHPEIVAEAPAIFATHQPETRNPIPETALPVAESPSLPVPSFRILGQAGGSYIILEDDTGVKLIDQHALHERILFEQLLARAEGRSRGDSQGLLIAETLELNAVQAAVFSQDENAQQILSNLGFEVESFGPRSVAVRAVPAILKSSNAGSLVRDVLDALAGSDDPALKRSTQRASLREKAVYILCCKGAIKAGERMTPEQMRALIEEYYRVVGAQSFTCPHGRPLAIELSWEDLERGVGRR